jgi:hypothetical protein
MQNNQNLQNKIEALEKQNAQMANRLSTIEALLSSSVKQNGDVSIRQ